MALRLETGSRDGRGTLALSDSPTVLVVIRDHRKCGKLVGALQNRGIPAVQANSRAQASYWLACIHVSLMVVDLEVEHATSILDRARREHCPAIALSEDAQRRCGALEAGCVDADRSNVDFDELALKIRSLLRDRESGSGVSRAGPLSADHATRKLYWSGVDLDASAHLFDLAAYLIEHAGKLVPTATLLGDVWGEAWATPDRVHKSVWRLRRLFGPGASSGFLAARRGHGYGIFPEADSSAGVVLLTLAEDQSIVP